MNAYVLTKNGCKDFWNFFSRVLQKENLTTEVFTDPEEFFLKVESCKTELDFLLIDFSAIQMDILNPYMLLLDQGIIIPVVIYNDPFPEEGYRALYWAEKNYRYFQPLLNMQKLKRFMPVWKKLEELLESKEINPYVNGLRKVKDVSTLENKEFWKNWKLTALNENLFTFLYENKNTEVEEKKLCLHLWNKFDEGTVNHLYKCIHSLRSAIEKSGENIRIIRQKKGCYLLAV